LGCASPVIIIQAKCVVMKNENNLSLFSLRFGLEEIEHWASRYPAADDYQVEMVIGPQVRASGYYTKSALVDICRWKTPRSRPRVARNPEGFVHAVTQTALSTPDKRLRIEVLTLLDGVSWPTASVLLHFGHPDPYPILDFRALSSLGIETPPVYRFDFWWEYVLACRHLATGAGVSMRTLDRALWQYSKENSRSNP